MIDWFVLLTPFILLPIFLLFAFIGCAEILGIEEGVPSDPEPPTEPPTVTFTYAGGLQPPPGASQVTRVAWIFSETLVYPPGEDFPPGFNKGVHSRGGANPPPLLPGGETVIHGQIGEPIDGDLICECRIFVDDEPLVHTIQTASKGPQDTDFPEFNLAADRTLT